MLGLTKAWYGDYSGNVVPFNSGGGWENLVSINDINSWTTKQITTSTTLTINVPNNAIYFLYFLEYKGTYVLLWLRIIDESLTVITRGDYTNAHSTAYDNICTISPDLTTIYAKSLYEYGISKYITYKFLGTA